MKSAGTSIDSTVPLWQKFAMALPVFLLIGVAFNQPRLHLQENLTSWKGGGFGMFATLDRHTIRPIIVTLTLREKTIQLDFRSYRQAISDDVDKVQHLEDTLALPSAGNLSALAEQMADVKYIVDGEYAIASTQGFGIPISVRQIRIELYRIQYDSYLNTGTWVKITSWPRDTE